MRYKTPKYLFVFLAVALAGCRNLEIDIPQIPEEKEFYACFNDTRTALSGLNLVWDADDTVNIFQGTARPGEASRYTVKSGYAGSSTATLVCCGEDFVADSTGLNVALYGTSLVKDFDFSGTTVQARIVMDSLRHYRKDSFGQEDMPMMAVSSSGENNLSFKNIFGVIELNIAGDGTSVNRIVVRGNKNENLTGQVSVLWMDGVPYLMQSGIQSGGKRVVLDCGEGVTLSKDDTTSFFISLPPVSFSAGLTVEIETSSGTITKTISSAISITRSAIKRFGAIVISGWDDEFATYATKYKFAAQSHSTITPMGTHFETFKAATEKQKAWLANPENEPYRYIMRNKSDTAWTLVEKTVNLAPFGTPCPADVVQHKIGNCVFLSVMAALSQSYPDYIKHIITRNQDGTFTVRMYDAMGNPLDVGITSKFFVGTGKGTTGVTGHNGVFTWSSVMEKALMKYESCFGFDYVDGIDPLPALAPFVGNGTSHKFAIKQVPEADMKHVVEVCQKSGHIMTGGFRTAGMIIGTAKTVTLHEYACLLCPDPAYLFTMRNPWGYCTGGTKRGDGCMDIAWDDELFPSNIYLRILDPGEAAPYFIGADKHSAYVVPF